MEFTNFKVVLASLSGNGQPDRKKATVRSRVRLHDLARSHAVRVPLMSPEDMMSVSRRKLPGEAEEGGRD